MKRIVIIGGGITGLSAAWEIQQKNSDIQFTIVESSDRFGGKVVSRVITMDNARFIVDGGPESFLTRKPEAWDLAQELGLQDEIMDPGKETKNIFILDQGIPHPVPLSPGLFLRSPLMSWRGKLRLLAEPFQPARRDDGDESLAAFAARRLGYEAAEKLIGPILGGIYNTDPHQQSIMISSPVMREMEREAGSLILASFKRMGKRRKANGKPGFITFKNGAEVLVQALVHQLKGDLRLNAKADKVVHADNRYQVVLANGETIEADAVILTTLANVTATLLREVAPKAAGKLSEIKHKNIGTISLVFHESDVPARPLINGLMIPRREGRAVDALTFTSRKMPSRSTEGFVLVRAFFGGSRPDVVKMNDQELLETVSTEIKELLNITARPTAYTLFHWEEGFPQAPVGHLARVAEVESLLPKNIKVAGSSYRGIAVPDCIKQGREAAKSLLTAQLTPA